jgi:diguanylate cyclase (GGDEF)-like protein
MRVPRPARRVLARLSLTRQVAVLSLIPVLVLGAILTRVVEGQIVARSVADASQTARLIAEMGVQPRVTPLQLSAGLSPEAVAALDRQVQAGSVRRDLARIKIWNAQGTIVYSDDHALIGMAPQESDELRSALAGRPNDATVVTPAPNSETAPEVGLGRLVEVYVPLRFSALSAPSGVFEVYLRYAPIASAIASDKQTILIVVGIGLALLWALLFRIVARASRRLRAQSEENYLLARYDQLTGLPNRTLFHELVAKRARETQDRPDDVAVLLIDLDGFTEINNALGGRTGNQLLQNVGERLRARFGEDASVARLGADEFAVLCSGTGGLEGAVKRAAAVQSSLESPVTLGGVAVNVDANIGVAVGQADESPEAFIQRADAALARAKAHHSRVEVHSAERDSFDASRLILLGQVRDALDREEFVLHYQPKVELKTGRAISAEALVRWHHPTRGVLMPGTFMTLIEQTALMSATTEYVLARAMRQMVRWRERGVDIGVSVNLSARNLVEDDLPARIAQMLREHRIEADRLTVEVTESATMSDPERAVTLLSALREGGVRVSIDDFGTGNASITYLTRLPATELKIDRSLAANVCESPRAEAIMRSTIDLARYLGLTAVAEGIESAEVLERLIELGCEAGQGYLFARALLADELVAWIGRRPAHGTQAAAARSHATASAPGLA